MEFTVEDRYLIISLQQSKGNAGTRLRKMFSEKRRNVNGLQTLIKKLITLASSIDYQVYWEPTTDQHALQSQIVIDNSVV